MKRAAILFLLLVPLIVFGQTVSYWFQGWERKPDARQAQEYFMLPGYGMTFTYANNRVILNVNTSALPSPAVGPWSTDGTNVWWTNTIPGQVYIGNGSGPHINLYTDGRGNFESNLTTKAKLSSLTLEVSSNAVFGGILYGNGAGLTNVPTVGLTTNFTVFLSNGDTNQLFFTNGLLVAMSQGTPVFSGFYLLDDSGANILDDNGNKIIVNP